MTLIELAHKLRPYIEKAASFLEDADALEAKELYPRWSGEQIKYIVGERVLYNDILYKVLQEHISQDNWSPDAAPSLFAKVLIPDVNIIPEWEQPDSTNPYMAGDKVMFNGKVYESIINNNVWAPNIYGWKEV